MGPLSEFISTLSESKQAELRAEFVKIWNIKFGPESAFLPTLELLFVIAKKSE